MLKKPQNVYLPIDKFQAKVFKKNEGERSEWVTKFALALAEEAEEPFAKELLNRAQADLYKDIVRGWRFNARRSLESSGIKDPTDKQVHEKCIDEYGDEYVEAMELLKASSKRIKAKALKMENDESTAGAPTREDGESKSDSGNAGNLESATPATISQDASTRKGEDDSKVPPSCTLSSKEPVVLNLAYSGEFGNVTLTQEQYNSLLQKFGNKTACDRAIDSLSAKLENGELKAKSHYAVLVKWANYRNDKADERNDDGETYLEKNWRKALNNVGMDL